MVGWTETRSKKERLVEIMVRTNIIVWLDDDEEWYRVYIQNGKLYIRIGVGMGDFALLNNCNIREISNL